MTVSLFTLINPSMTRTEARQALLKAGWTFAGGGSFASVWLSPDGERVIKVTKPDAGAEAIYSIATANPENPHLPRYFARLELGNGGWAYECEALEELNDYGTFQSLQQLERRTYRGEPAPEDTLPALVEAFQLIDSYRRSSPVQLVWDLPMSNIMLRGDVIVMNDPLFDTKCGSQWSCNGSKHDSATVAKSLEADPIAQLMQPQFDAA